MIDLIKPDPGDALGKSFDKWNLWAEDSACCDYSFKLELSELNDDVKEEMQELASDNNYGVNCFKMSMETFKDLQLMDFFETCSKMGKEGLSKTKILMTCSRSKSSYTSP